MMPLILQHQNMEFIKSSQKSGRDRHLSSGAYQIPRSRSRARRRISKSDASLCAPWNSVKTPEKCVCDGKKAHIPHIYLFIQHGDGFLQPGRKEGHRDAQYKGGWLCDAHRVMS